MTDTNDQAQTSFSEDYRFVSKCTSCGKPMGHMSIDRFDREPGPLGAMFTRRVFVMWIDPTHDCDYLKIEPKQSVITA